MEPFLGAYFCVIPFLIYTELVDIFGIYKYAMDLEFDYELKIVLIDDDSVGKSSIIRRYVADTFTDDYIFKLG